MLILILGLIIFLGAHVFVTLRPQRAALIERVGLKTYKTGYAPSRRRVSLSSSGASSATGPRA